MEQPSGPACFDLQSQRKSLTNVTEGVILPDPCLKFPDAQCCGSSLGLRSFSVNILSSFKEDKVAKPILDVRCREQCCHLSSACDFYCILIY